MIREITSRQNEIIKFAKALQQRKERKNKNLFVLEGTRFVAELRENIKIKSLIATSEHDLSEYDCKEKYYVSRELFEYISDVKTPQGIMAVCEIPEHDEAAICNAKRVLYLDSVQNADNVGAIIRSAACLGYECVVLSENCADPYSPKALRAAAGNTFKIKVYTQKGPALLNELKNKGFCVCGAHLKGSCDVKINDDKAVLIIGNEGNGMSDDVTALCDKLIKIKMHSGCESLNAACAAAILMYISME